MGFLGCPATISIWHKDSQVKITIRYSVVRGRTIPIVCVRLTCFTSLGIRKSSRVLIYVNVKRALADGIKFYLSLNGVILSPGNDMGYLEPKYFERVERVAIQRRQSLQGWEAPTQEHSPNKPSTSPPSQEDASEILAREV